MKRSTTDENTMWNKLKDNTKINTLVGPKNTSLPSFGWTKSCYFCSSATSRVKILLYNKKEYYTFQCKDCSDNVLGI
jgi:hypothetical protein